MAMPGSAPWSEHIALNDAAYRRQIAYLFERSKFYRDKLTAAGFATPEAVGGLSDIHRLPLTEKDEIRRTRSDDNPVGDHLCVPLSKTVRIFTTSGTTGTPSFIPLTRNDLGAWTEIAARSYSATGLGPGEGLISTYGAGPFAAGVTFDAFSRIGVSHIPIGSGNTERLMTALRLLKPTTIALTPSYASHLAEWGRDRNIDVGTSSVKRLLVAGEPGGGEPATRTRLESDWQAEVTEIMGIGDIAASLWSECSEQQGMHFSGSGFVHPELIDPDTGEALPMEDGVEGELVYTHLRQEAVPLLRFRSRDHVRVWTGLRPNGRDTPRVRCLGRTDDMLIVRGVNVFPSALREVVSGFAPAVTGVISVRPKAHGFRQDPPLKLVVETTGEASNSLAAEIQSKIRDTLLVTTEIELVAAETLPRSSYKSQLVDWSEADQ